MTAGQDGSGPSVVPTGAITLLPYRPIPACGIIQCRRICGQLDPLFLTITTISKPTQPNRAANELDNLHRSGIFVAQPKDLEVRTRPGVPSQAIICTCHEK